MNERVANISNIIEGLSNEPLHAQGKNMRELKDNLAKLGLSIDSADAFDMENSKHFNDEKVTLYDVRGKEYTGLYNRYSDGGREIIYIKRK